jgi:hypothetical protein
MNILALAFSMVLACSAIISALLSARARAMARDYLCFAAVLYLALGVFGAGTVLTPAILTRDFVQAVTLLVLALAPPATVLALFCAFEHPPSALVATPILVIACLGGIAAAAFGIAPLSSALLVGSVFAILALLLRRWRTDKRSAAYAMLSACCLLAGAGTTLPGQDFSLLFLFGAAALLGFGLAVQRPLRISVAQKRDLRGEILPVGRASVDSLRVR